MCSVSTNGEPAIASPVGSSVEVSLVGLFHLKYDRPNPFGANLEILFHSYTRPVSTFFNRAKTYSGPRTGKI